MSDTFKCEQCGGVFRKAWSDAEQARERVEVFGPPEEDDAVVCDDCYRKLMEWARKKGLVR